MTNDQFKPRRCSVGHLRQQGVVLLIALIALVALSLAGIGFMRSVDTAGVMAGNMAFNRASVSISDAGMEAARTVLSGYSIATCAGESCLWQNNAGTAITNGYWAISQPNFDYRSTDWGNANIMTPAAIALLPAAQQAALAGYDIRYIVHRMCQTTGDPVTANCVFENVTVTGGTSKGGIDYSSYLNPTQQSSATPFYRVTMRVAGPRNSLTYIQVWML